MNKIFFDSWESIVRIIIIGILAYGSIVVLLRVSGKRTLSKMNAFDLIITIALGSTLATVILNKNVSLIDGVLAFFILIFLQYIITYSAVRSERFNRLINGGPSLLVYRGNLLSEALKKERVTEKEIYAVLRDHDIASIDDVTAVVLETDGSMTVLSEPIRQDNKILQQINFPPEKP